MKGFWLKKTVLGLTFSVLMGSVFAWGAQTKPEAKVDPEKVLVKIMDQEIREKDVDQIIQTMGPQGVMMYNNPQGRRAILDELVARNLFALRGAEEKLDQTPEFKTALEAFRVQFLARAAIDAVLKDVAASEKDAKNFYDKNPDKFTQPERVHVRHILVSDDVTSADTLTKVQADLKAGASFDEIAKSLSLCSSSEQGGDLGEVSKGQMVPEFEAAAFALKKPGDLSAPIKTQFGWHIIKLEERIPASLEPFDAVKPQIVQYLTNEKKNEAFKAALEALKKTYKLEILIPENNTSEDKK